jgi:hypothetical protein
MGQAELCGTIQPPAAPRVAHVQLTDSRALYSIREASQHGFQDRLRGRQPTPWLSPGQDVTLADRAGALGRAPRHVKAVSYPFHSGSAWRHKRRGAPDYG